jgi:Ca2+-binding EF-hand superfamily protein
MLYSLTSICFFSPNGKLSKDRFVSIYEQFYPGGKAKDFCKYAFGTFDRDNNGTSKIDLQTSLLFFSMKSSVFFSS